MHATVSEPPPIGTLNRFKFDETPATGTLNMSTLIPHVLLTVSEPPPRTGTLNRFTLIPHVHATASELPTTGTLNRFTLITLVHATHPVKY